jgi:hypothetical protein
VYVHRSVALFLVLWVVSVCMCELRVNDGEVRCVNRCVRCMCSELVLMVLVMSEVKTVLYQAVVLINDSGCWWMLMHLCAQCGLDGQRNDPATF